MSEAVEKVYADALFSLAREDGNETIELVRNSLKIVQKSFDENPKYPEILSSPALTKEKQIAMIDEVYKNAIAPYAYNFLCVLAENRRLSYFKPICKSFNELYDEYFNILHVRIITAKPLSDEMKKKTLARLSEVTGKNTELSAEVRPELIGGAIIEYANTKLDGSVKTKLEEMKNNIAKSII